MKRLGVLFLGALACGTSTSSGPPAAPEAGAGDAGFDDATPVDASGQDAPVDAPADAPREAGVACTAIPLLGNLVPGNFVASAPPAATGGAIVDGTYVLTKYQIYTGPGGMTGATGQSLRTTMRLGGAGYESVSNTSADPSEIRVSGTFTASGSSFAWTLQCPAPTQGTETYTTDGTTLVQLTDVGANTLEMTFTKQ